MLIMREQIKEAVTMKDKMEKRNLTWVARLLLNQRHFLKAVKRHNLRGVEHLRGIHERRQLSVEHKMDQ